MVWLWNHLSILLMVIWGYFQFEIMMNKADKKWAIILVIFPLYVMWLFWLLLTFYFQYSSKITSQ